MQLHEKQQIAERLAADLERREIRPFEINHGIIDNPYIYDGKPIARKYIYYIAKGPTTKQYWYRYFFQD